ncbi:hypothetical protein QQS21_000441 [Conoideocrella luteorostrata]|uniref:Uncharacterized protein n=1 Tax=Conoideocrella luteorostrata TaxID=1105319 RepID=A0AAJ0CYW2_9HYPO|nr:hypothetical protein QQS21_000441 [Conoideocrella luteorostrata]
MPQCQALRLSDDERCTGDATNANNLFCWFHAKQVYGLYMGYKRRNAQLEAIDDGAPSYLKSSQIPLANDSFQGIKDEHELRQLHSHLFSKYVLLSKVIDARKLHHKHFYPLQVDYGHQAYLDKLSSQRHTVLRALASLERRTAEVLYKKEEWFTWVRQVQGQEEATREKEQKKVKQEASLFKRNMKNLQARLNQIQQKEESKRQDAYLEDAYRERMSISEGESDADGEWDPVEDLEYERRHRYIDLIKHFLWMEVLSADEDITLKSDSNSAAQDVGVVEQPKTATKNSKKRSKGKAKEDNSAGRPNAAAHASRGASTGQRKLLAMLESKKRGASNQMQEPDKKNIETEEEMRKRLSQGVEKNYEDAWGLQLVGTIENPLETHKRTAPMTDDEIESIIKEIKEIKLLLFSRLLLAQASLLPGALKANSVSAFLSDAAVTEADLRDLCLKVEEPTLQVIRDACADLARNDEVEEDDPNISEDDDGDETFADMLCDDMRFSHLHSEDWLSERFIAKVKRQTPKKKCSPPKTKVTICGKTIWNHTSEKAMSRDGWLQFSVVAKDCSLEAAVQLCRNWKEFSDLNLLVLWQYFPASNWAAWGSNRLIQQLQKLGLFPYFIDLQAQEHTRYNQVGGRSHGRRQHDIIETRNVIVGHMKRNHPVTRRFIQYLIMRSGDLLVLVRDGKTGRVITAPPEEHLWTYRKKQGIGRASKHEWVNVLEVGHEYFDMTDTY